MSRAFAGLLVLFGLAATPALAGDVREFHRTVCPRRWRNGLDPDFQGFHRGRTVGQGPGEVFARIEADTSCGSDSEQQERVRLTKVDFDSTASRLEVHSNYDRLKDFPPIQFRADGFDTTCSAYPFIHYRLRIPRTARLDVEDHKSKIAVEGLRSEARIRTHKGSVDVKGHEGALDLSTHKGDVRVDFARLGADSRLETYKGDIEISLPKSAGFDLDARVERGGILDAGFRLDERIVGRRERVYEQKVNGGGPRLELSTRNGSIQIREK